MLLDRDLDQDGVLEPEERVTFHADGLGSIVALTDHTGAVVERTRYDGFGQPTLLGPGPDGAMDTADDVILPQSAFGNPYGFTGREVDPESGLSYYRRRYYDGRIGRFISPDPIGRLSAENLYVYVKNNPVNFTDPFGEQPVGGCLTCGVPSLGSGIGLPPLPGVGLPFPSPSKDEKHKTACPVEPEDEEGAGKEVYCTLIDRGPTVCIYNCKGRIVRRTPPVPGEESSCPPTILYRFP